jgi:hypothetical protein
MNFFWSWADEAEVFVPEKHARHDVTMYALKLREEENQFPRAEVEIALADYQRFSLQKQQHVFLSCEHEGKVTLLLRGNLQAIPVSIEKERVWVWINGAPSNSSARLREMCSALKYDPLFIPSIDRSDPPLEAYLQGKDHCVYWSRITQNPCLSSWFEGSQALSFKENILQDGLTITFKKNPSHHLVVKVIAHWEQFCQGHAQLDSYLAQAVPGGMLSTLTGKDLEKRWFASKEIVGRSGYRILESRLQKVTPPRTGMLNLYPQLSKPLCVSSQSYGGEGRRQVRLRRNWYKPSLKIGWTYRQPREEIATFHVTQQVLLWANLQPKEEQLTFYLGDVANEDRSVPWMSGWVFYQDETVLHEKRRYVCLKTHRASDKWEDDQTVWKLLGPETPEGFQHMRPTFFDTDRGRQALQHALDVAVSHLAQQSRALEITFLCPFESGMAVTVDTHIDLQDPRVPGGRCRGKVTALSLEVDGQTGIRVARITLGVSLAGGKQQPLSVQMLQETSYAEEGVIAPEGQPKSGWGVTFHPWEGREEQSPGTWSGYDILKQVSVTHDAQSQEEALLEDQGIHGISSVLEKHKTRVRLGLGDLRSRKRVVRKLDLQVKGSWMGPGHLSH